MRTLSLTSFFTRGCILCTIFIFGQAQAEAETIAHRLHVNLLPQQHSLRVQDEIHFPATDRASFVLHAGLDPRIITPGATLTKTGQLLGRVPLETYLVTLPAESDHFTLSYTGMIEHELSRETESPGRSHQQLAGLIAPDGVFLDGGSAWYPVFPDALQTFSLEVELPQGWSAISQGSGPGDKPSVNIWQTDIPQEEIYLVAAPFKRYFRDGPVQAQIYLRQDDPQLAARYLDATERYLALYQALLGPYPYTKFALVENFWETGYGMPSFTLLGSQVIRLPFIPDTSYPHEILHNWWGNGVYIDYEKGNWSEGLTAYLADHLLKEQAGQGVEYRRSALQRYADFVRVGNDFPLSEFRARHTMASQAVGYDKSLMIFHMLRRQIGDEAFIDGLRRFYRERRFQHAGYADLQAAFEATSGQKLGEYFTQWTTRTGAPRLELSKLKVQSRNDASGHYSLSGRLEQTQAGEPFILPVPVHIYLAGGKPPLQLTIPMRTPAEAFQIELPAAPTRLEIDPWFDLFRTLDPAESPASLSQLFAAESCLFVLPSTASAELLAGYRHLAEGWSKDYAKASIVLDSEIEQLPETDAVWLLGWENRFAEPLLKELDPSQIKLEKDSLELAGRHFDRQQSLVLRAQTGNQALLATANPLALPGLGRKVPHYGKYSYLAFSGDKPDNQLKGQWEVRRSPLQVSFSKEEITNKLRPAPLWSAEASNNP